MTRFTTWATSALICTVGAVLIGCGGGAASTSAPVASAPPPPAPASVLNPLTGLAAGEAVNVIHGQSVPGASVTAYTMLPDGSSGPALGPAAPTDIDGQFALALNAPAGHWIRIVSAGGRYKRTYDHSLHPVDTMEMVTPYVSSRFDYLVLTPVSDISARIMAYHARSGLPLPDAFRKAMSSVLNLDMANLVFDGDVTVYLNLLKGTVASDLGYKSAETRNKIDVQIGIDRLGAFLDLPSTELWRALALAGERDFAAGALDGSGQPVTVGTWVDGTFSTTQRTSLQQMLNGYLTDDMKETDATGARVAPSLRHLIGRYMILDFVVEHACVTQVYGTLWDRYPFHSGRSIPQAGPCREASDWVARFYTRWQTTNTRHWK